MTNVKCQNGTGCRLRLGRLSLSVTLLYSIVVFAAEFCPAEEPSERLHIPLSAPVQAISIGTPQTGAMPGARVGAAPPPQPTLPSGKLPQYDLSDPASSAKEQTLWLRLEVPQRPLLLEVTLQIDGRPFREARERRVQAILQQLKEAAPAAKAENQTEPTPNAPDVAAKTVGEADSAEAVSQLTPAMSVVELVRRYAAAAGRDPSPDEIGWLITQRIDGPPLLLIRQPFQAFRADQKPAFVVLDRDRDGTLSNSEIDNCVESIRECDLNRDDIVDVLEIGKVAAAYRERRVNPDVPLNLLTVVSHQDKPDSKPDLKLTVAFNTKSPEKSTVTLTEVRPSSPEGPPPGVHLRDGTIILNFADCTLEFSAVQGAVGDQVSIGAVNDGYPLLPALDLHDDGRFTLRELKTLAARLREFDRDGDGAITLSEIKPTIRVCFGLGPVVHNALAGIRSIHSPPSQPPEPGPEWFTRMDRNKDHDLTRGEFPGTDEQFAKLDADKDELVSAAEARRFDEQNQSKTGPNPGETSGIAKPSTSNSTRNDPQ